VVTRGLSKSYRTGHIIQGRRPALVDLDLTLLRGEILGYVGPNGSGKTTTLKLLVGLLRPDRGDATVLGEPLASRAWRMRAGYLPENPYLYDYLTPAEYLDYVGRLFGLDRARRRERTRELIALVGLERSARVPMRRFSKGMLQRAGLAQALMSDPEIVVLDEPMSGLDPLGRKEIRDLMLELRDKGKTVFFSTHILSDVEAITDDIAIIARGQLQAQGTPAELVTKTLLGTEITVRSENELDGELTANASRVLRAGNAITVVLPSDVDVDVWIDRAHAAGAKIVAVSPRHETLEDLFLREVAKAS
jgi:ABC-2 type transport system ATP-binding protein